MTGAMLLKSLSVGLFASLLFVGNSNGEGRESGSSIRPDKVLHRTIQVSFSSGAGSQQSDLSTETRERVTFAIDGEDYIISHQIDEIVFPKNMSELANGSSAFKTPYAYRSDRHFNPLEMYRPDDYWTQFAKTTKLTMSEVDKIRKAGASNILSALSRYDVLALPEFDIVTAQFPFVRQEVIPYSPGMIVSATATYTLVKKENGKSYIEKKSVSTPESVKAAAVEMSKTYVKKYGGSDGDIKDMQEKMEAMHADEKLHGSEICTLVFEDKVFPPIEVRCIIYSSWDDFTENVIVKQQWK